MRIDAKEAPSVGTELATISAIQTIVPAEFFKPDGSAAVLAALKEEVRKQAASLDISTELGRAAIASLAYKVARSKTALDEQGKTLVADQKAALKAIDIERAKVWDELDALQKEVRKPLTDWENAEKARVAEHEAALALIAAECDGIPVWTIAECEQKMVRVNELYTARDWQEFHKRATDTRNAAMFVLQSARADAQIKRERELEAERLAAEAREQAIKAREEAAAKAAKEEAERKAQEQARLAREAAEAEQRRIENERIEAEARAQQAEAQRIAAEQKAERDRIAAEEAAKEAERQAEIRLEAERQAAQRREREAAEKAEREREAAIEDERRRVAEEKRKEADEAEKRARNRAHQAAINREILTALGALHISEELGKLLIGAIVKGAVPHVTINY